MNEIVLRRKPSPASAEEASRWLEQCLLPFAAGAGGSGSLGATALRRLVTRSRLGKLPGRPNAATHRFTLRGTARAQFVKAEVTLHVGLEVPSVVRLESELSLSELQQGFALVAASGALTTGSAGDPACRIGALNQLCFLSTLPAADLPPGAVCTPSSHGVLLLACSMGAEPTSVRPAVEALGHALKSPRPLGRSAVPFESALPMRPAFAEPPARVALEVDPDETVPIPLGLSFSGAMPFSGTTGDETLERLFARPAADLIADEAGATVALPITGGSSRVPVLSLEEYVELRALLTLFGTEHEATWARFGLHEKQRIGISKLENGLRAEASSA